MAPSYKKPHKRAHNISALIEAASNLEGSAAQIKPPNAISITSTSTSRRFLRTGYFLKKIFALPTYLPALVPARALSHVLALVPARALALARVLALALALARVLALALALALARVFAFALVIALCTCSCTFTCT